MYLPPRNREILVNICGKRLERRDVDDPYFIRQPALLYAFPQEIVDRREERGQGLARAGGRGDERVFAAADGAPAFELGFGRRGAFAPKGAVPPLPQYRMKIGR